MVDMGYDRLFASMAKGGGRFISLSIGYGVGDHAPTHDGPSMSVGVAGELLQLLGEPWVPLCSLRSGQGGVSSVTAQPNVEQVVFPGCAYVVG